MRKRSAVVKFNVGQLLAGGLMIVSSAVWAGAPLNSLRGLEVHGTAAGAQVVVAGSRPPTFTVFRLSDPDRLVVDLSSADASAIKGVKEGQGPVAGVVASQFADERSSVGRVLVTLKDASQYDVRADGNKVVISVQGGASVASAAPSAATLAAAEPGGQTAPAAAPVASVAPAAEPNVIKSEGDERSFPHPARRLQAVQVAGAVLRLKLDGDLEKYELLQLENPARLALDLFGVSLATRVPRQKEGVFTGLRAGAHEDKVRLVVDLQHTERAPHVRRVHHGLELSLEEARAPAVAKVTPALHAPADSGDSEVIIDGRQIPMAGTETAAIRPEPPASRPSAPALRGPVEVKDLTFAESDLGGRVDLKLSGETSFKVEHPDPRSAVLVLDSAHLPKRLERSLDTSALGTPIKMVSAFAVPGAGDRIRVVVAADGALEEKVEKTAQGLAWKLTARGVKTEAVAVNQKTAGFTTEASTYAAEGAPRRAAYVGKKVSFEFKDIDIHNLLRVIAEVSKKNVIVSDDVSGKVTIRLRNVPWDQALELILRSKGLGKEEVGNIIRVAPLAALEHEAAARAARAAANRKAEELQVQLIPVNYAKASELAERIKDVLSERGTVTVDSRTNVLIVRDIASGISKSKSLIQNLDTQTPQVLIESRIVEANTTFTRQLGVQWGGNGQAAPTTNNATGLAFPNSVRVTGGVDPGTAPTTGLTSTPNFAVNLPAAVGAGSGGALGFVFGSAGGALALNLRLSALENQGSVKTISAPKVTTLDNNLARISQGLSIPYSQVSAAGVNTVFVEARLSLEVTPHITQDGSVLMSIHAENNQPDSSAPGANGQPAIQRKEANTQVLVKDGETTVIGGIYVRRGSSSVAMVPWLGRIPIIGFFFRTDTQAENRQELLIFITPRIINRTSMAQGNL